MLFTVAVGNIEYLGGYSGISNIPVPNPIRIPLLPVITFDSKVQYYYLVLILLVVIILVCKALYKAWIGGPGLPSV